MDGLQHFSTQSPGNPQSHCSSASITMFPQTDVLAAKSIELNKLIKYNFNDKKI